MNTRLIILRGNFEIDNKFVTSKQSQDKICDKKSSKYSRYWTFFLKRLSRDLCRQVLETQFHQAFLR